MAIARPLSSHIAMVPASPRKRHCQEEIKKKLSPDGIKKPLYQVWIKKRLRQEVQDEALSTRDQEGTLSGGSGGDQ